ncbi:MAG: peptidylprolyl isomerase [Oligoflexia bacterium]|nr:peptidylprolyl isomerase [Oligoflexia bacterium]
MFKKPIYISILAVNLVSISAVNLLAEQRPEILIDRVVASVDGKPIMFREVLARLGAASPHDAQAAAQDPNFNKTLDQIILERVITEEARNRRVDVSDDEISRYMKEVAARNNLSDEGFEKALQQEKLTIQQYKEQIKFEILRSKLASSLLQGGVAVSDSEIDEYLKAKSELDSSGHKVRISRIMVGEDKRSEEDARKLAIKLREEAEDGADFAKLARENSDGPEAAEGGSLGVMAESDLSPEIVRAIKDLDDGEVSEPIHSGDGYHIFKVEERLESEEKEQQAEREEAKKTLQQQKVQAKAQDYFTAELFKLHSVDRKI